MERLQTSETMRLEEPWPIIYTMVHEIKSLQFSSDWGRSHFQRDSWGLKYAYNDFRPPVERAMIKALDCCWSVSRSYYTPVFVPSVTYCARCRCPALVCFITRGFVGLLILFCLNYPTTVEINYLGYDDFKLFPYVWQRVLRGLRGLTGEGILPKQMTPAPTRDHKSGWHTFYDSINLCNNSFIRSLVLLVSFCRDSVET